MTAKRSAPSAASSSRRRWALVVGICLGVGLWAASCQPLPAESVSGQQTVTVSSAMLREWTESLQRADAYLTQAQSRLENSQANLTTLSDLLRQAEKRLSRLDAKLTLWQEHSAGLETSLQDSKATLGQLRETLRVLRERYDALSQTFSDYKQEAQKQIAAREQAVWAWRGVAIGAVVAAVLGWLVAFLT